MVVVLQPLEFISCLGVSPHFRENLQRHEKELERTSQQIKCLTKEVKNVVQAAKSLGAAQLMFAASMEQFEFACIGDSITEDERVIGHSLHHFSQHILTIDHERDRMLGRVHEQIIEPLEKLRKEHIGAVKEGKKKFDKTITEFCQTQERTLSFSTKSTESTLKQADTAMDLAERDFCQASLEYVFQLQTVQERIKFDLVETLQGFVSGWWNFDHKALVKDADPESLVRDLEPRIQRTRSNLDDTSKLIESLMKKMMEFRQMIKEDKAVIESVGGVFRAGYVFVMEKTASGTTWRKHFCTYNKNSSTLTLMPYNQINGNSEGPAKSVVVEGAQPTSDFERRFCWKALVHEGAPLVLQALDERERASWLKALSPTVPRAPVAPLWPLDDAGINFVRCLTKELEARCLDDQGLYRVEGVESEVSRLVAMGRALRLPPNFSTWESSTLTSALKSYLNALPDPLLTHRLHDNFLAAAKSETAAERVSRLQTIVGTLPPDNHKMLGLVLWHLERVAARRDRNLMTPSNLAVCFGLTLLRPKRESIASILELKFYKVLVETLIENAAVVFAPSPPTSLPAPLAGKQGAPAPAHGPPSDPDNPTHGPIGVSATSPDLAAAPPLSALNGIAGKRRGPHNGEVSGSCSSLTDQSEQQASSQMLQSKKFKCGKCPMGRTFCKRCERRFCSEHSLSAPTCPDCGCTFEDSK